jgi:hypothetical protein
MVDTLMVQRSWDFGKRNVKLHTRIPSDREAGLYARDRNDTSVCAFATL